MINTGVSFFCYELFEPLEKGVWVGARDRIVEKFVIFLKLFAHFYIFRTTRSMRYGGGYLGYEEMSSNSMYY